MNLSFIDDAVRHRAGDSRRRTRLGYLVPTGVTLGWLICVTAFGLWPRVADNWVAFVTMLFGSFVGGATPQGSGAVAFPVFTKLLDIPAEVARSFSLFIQAMGLGTAVVVILIRRRTVDRLSLKVMIPVGLISFLVSITLLSDRTEPFWPMLLPGAYVKVGFSLLVMVMATVVYLGTRVPVREVRDTLTPARPRQIGLLVLAGILGGFATSQVGSGVDVLLYLAAVVLLGLEPRVAVPTSVVVMAILSWAGMLYLGLGQGMVMTRVEDGFVVGLGANPLPAGAYPGERFDLFGLWLAAIPAACWAASLGSAFAASISSRTLSAFVGALALLEVVTTIVFLPELHTDRALQVFAVASAVGLLALLWVCQRYRHVLAGTTFDRNRSLSREAVDVLPNYADESDGGGSDAAGR